MPIFRNNEALLEAFRAGDKDALETVYWRYVNVVAKVLREGVTLGNAKRVSGVRDDIRQDLVQETFIRAFRSSAREAFDGARAYQPYLLTICRNLLIDWTRKQGREITHEAIDQLVEQASTQVVVAEEPSQDWADPDTMVLVDQYIKSLPEELRTVYDQRYVKCVSQVDAAKALGLTRQRIRTLENRLRDGLRALL